MSDPRPIGVFDSGMGGLTVLRAIRARLPQEDLVYLGDTARLPYGTKSADTVTRYAAQATRVLIARGVKLVVIACNTASAVALEPLRTALAPVPVIGVVGPGARAAARASESGRIAVIATEGTVAGGAYPRAIAAARSDATVVQRACPLFVPLAEEGIIEGAIAELAAQRYLDPLFGAGAPGPRPDTLVLGCTHFPVLAPVIAAAAGRDVRLVDSAETTADEVADALAAQTLARVGGRAGAPVFLATDAPERFARVGALFFGAPIAADAVSLIDLQSVSAG